MNKHATQGRLVIEALKQRPLTYRQMLNLGVGNSPWKRALEYVDRHGEVEIIKGKHASGCVTWAARTVRK